MAIPGDPDAARALEALASLQRQLGEAVSRLEAAAARAIGLAEQTDWRTDAATLFHESAEAFRREVATLASDVEGARDDLGRIRARLEAQAWGWAG
jgi:ubiquinone biosynthesis protein UbiJ